MADWNIAGEKPWEEEEEPQVESPWKIKSEDPWSVASEEPYTPPEIQPTEQPDLAATEDYSNIERVGERISTMGAKSIYGLGEAAARVDPTPQSLIMDIANRFDEEGMPSIWDVASPLMDYFGAKAVKGGVEIADVLTEGDVRENMIKANEMVRKEADAALGSPEMQYQGNEIQKLGWEIVEGAANMVPALAAGWATKNPGTTLGMIGMQVAGGTYSDYMEKTGDHDTAIAAAKFHVAAEVIPETIPVMAFLRKAGSGPAVARFLEGTLGEGVQEALTEILQGSYDRVALENMSLKDAIRNIDWDQVKHAGIVGIGVGGVLVTPGTVADVYEHQRQKREAALGQDIGGEPRPLEENATAIDEELARTPAPMPEAEIQPEAAPAEEITPEVPAGPDTILDPRGLPWRSPKNAEAYARNMGIQGYEPIDQGAGNWVLQRIAPQPTEITEEKIGAPEAAVEVQPDEKRAEIDELAQEAASNEANDRRFSEAMAEAGNYNKPTIDSKVVDWMVGMPTKVENAAGTKRKPDWPELKHPYGYFQKTEGFDGDEVDVIYGPKMGNKPNQIFVVNQIHPDTGKFDEHKVILGVDNEAEAQQVYLDNYEEGWQGLDSVDAYQFDDFKSKLKTGFFKNSTLARQVPRGEFKKPLEVSDIITVSSGTVEGMTNEEVQQMQNESAKGWAEVLPELPQRVYAELASEAFGVTPASAKESDLQSLRQRLQTEGETVTGALQAVWGSELTDASRRLRQAAGRDMDVSRVPSEPPLTAEEEIKALKKAEQTRIRSEQATERVRRNLQPDSENDDLITYIRKLGGINTDVESDVRGRLSHLDDANRMMGLPRIEQKGKGLTLDALGERLIEAGYLAPDPRFGNGVDKDALIELLYEAEGGEPIMSLAAQDRVAKEKFEQEQQEEYEAWINQMADEEAAQVKAEIEAIDFDNVNQRAAMAAAIDRAMDVDETAVDEILDRNITDAEAIDQLNELARREAREQPTTTEKGREEAPQPAEVEPTPAAEAEAEPEFELTPEKTEAQKARDLEIEKEKALKGPEVRPAEAQRGDDLFAYEGQLEPDLFAQPTEEAVEKPVEKPVEKGRTYIHTYNRAKENIARLNTKQIKDMARDAGVKQTGSREDLIDRMATARVAIEAVSEYDTEQAFYDGVKAGEINKEQLAEWTAVRSDQKLTPNPMAIEPNMRAVFSFAARAMGPERAPTRITEAEEEAKAKKVRKQAKKTREANFPKRDPADIEEIERIQEIDTYADEELEFIEDDLYQHAVRAINEQFRIINDYGYDVDRIREQPGQTLPDTLAEAKSQITHLGSALVALNNSLKPAVKGYKNVRPEIIFNRLANYLVDVGAIEGGSGSGKRAENYTREHYPYLADMLDELDAHPESIATIKKEKAERVAKRKAAEDMLAPDEWKEMVDARTGLFTNPDGLTRAADLALQTGYLPQKDADKIIQGWKDQIKELASDPEFHENVRDKVILSLFDASGEWARPWAEAGYDVRTIDLKTDDVDVMTMNREWFEDYDMTLVHGVLAACPCTDFSLAATRDWRPGPSSRVEGGKDYTGRTHASVDLVNHTLDIIDYLVPQWWALENPVGRIADITGVPDAKLRFQPHHYGDPYTKETDIFGKFNPDLPQANVDPVEGSRMHKLGSASEKKEGKRSLTPEGFALAFFMANHDRAMPGYAHAAKDYVAALPKSYTDQMRAEAEAGYTLGTQMADDVLPSGVVFKPHVMEAFEFGQNEAFEDWRIETSMPMPLLEKYSLTDSLDQDNARKKASTFVFTLNKGKGRGWDKVHKDDLKLVSKSIGLKTSGTKEQLTKALKDWYQEYKEYYGTLAPKSPGHIVTPPTTAKKKERTRINTILKNARKSDNLDIIELSAETEAETITQTAEVWLDDIDNRIKEVNKLRDCI